MRQISVVICIAFLALSMPSCGKKDRPMVPVEQLTIDNSNDYRFIFKNAVEEERRKDSRARKNPFRD
jgi:hypothetical protein